MLAQRIDQELFEDSVRQGTHGERNKDVQLRARGEGSSSVRSNGERYFLRSWSAWMRIAGLGPKRPPRKKEENNSDQSCQLTLFCAAAAISTHDWILVGPIPEELAAPAVSGSRIKEDVRGLVSTRHNPVSI